MTQPIPAFFMAPVPPSVAHAPWLWAFSVMGLLGGTLMAAEWFGSTVYKLVEDRRQLRDPLTMHRVMLALIMLATILRIGPDAVNVMVWPDVSPVTRYRLADWNRFFDGLSIFPFILAAMAGKFSQGVIRSQLIREPIPVHLWASWAQVRMSGSIAMVVVLISLGVTVLR